MRPITESDLRGSFVNCSKGETKRLGVPRDLDEQPWDDLDFLGWRDPDAPERGYLVIERDDGTLAGIALRAAPGTARGFTSRSMCSLCLTTHTSGGVALMTARRTGEAGWGLAVFALILGYWATAVAVLAGGTLLVSAFLPV